jgi:siroheme synthase-like protein
MTYFPVCLEMNGRPCAVIGGGAVAERKVLTLIEAQAEVTVISPRVTDAIERWAQQYALTLILRKYRTGDLAGFQVVFVATTDREVNDTVYREGKSCGAWVNAADDLAHCDFILPSILRRGDLVVAVSSSGTSPALSRTIREELESYFTDEYEWVARLAAEARKELQRHSIIVPYETWRQALNGPMRHCLRDGELVRAKSCLLRDLGVPQ